MQCIICESACDYFHTINYLNNPFCIVALNSGFDAISLYKCKNCDSVLSETHMNLSDTQYTKLLKDGHNEWERIKDYIYKQGITTFPIGTAPHIQIATLIKLSLTNALIPHGSFLDYGAGYGHLSNILEKYFCIAIDNYEPFASNINIKYLPRNSLGKYDMIINSAMFQCVRSLMPYDDMNSLLAPHGVFTLQTVVAAHITPELAEHMFFMPCVSNMPSNRGMEIFMERYGFSSSCYSRSAKSWLMFKDRLDAKIIEKINQELNAAELFYADGFMGFWK